MVAATQQVRRDWRGEIEMTECIICEGELDEKDSGWCETCAKFAPLLVGSDFNARPRYEDRQSLGEILAPNRGRTSHARWRSFLNSQGDQDIGWAFDNVEDSSDLIDPFPIDEAVVESGLQHLREELCGRSKPSEHVLDHLLQRGIPLGNGHWLSRLNDNWAFDGHPLLYRVPHDHLIRALTGTAGEKEQAARCDWPRLLMTLGIVAYVHPGRARRQFEHRFDLVADPPYGNVPILRRRHQERPELFGGARLFMEWVTYIRTSLRTGALRDEEENPPVGGGHRALARWHRRRMRIEADMGMAEPVIEGFNWEELYPLGLPWVNRWNELLDGGDTSTHLSRWGGRSVSVRRGKVHLRVIKDGRWIWTPLPPWPKLWALLLSWALSPPNSEQHRSLRALQWSWHNEEGELMPSAPDRRALRLLKDVCEGNERLTLSNSGGDIFVQGTSGLYYSVAAGPGAHGARFRVQGGPNLQAVKGGRGEPLCIHEERVGPRLPVGDVLVTVVLSLIDDLRSSENLGPLHTFIGRNMTRSDRSERDNPDWLRVQRQRFRNPPRRGRWLRVFPRLYDALVHMPLGTRMRVARGAPFHITMDGAMFAVLLNNEEELELAEGLFRLTGWRREHPEDEGGNRLWHRIDAPVERVRRNLVELLGPFERRHGRAGDPPWWNMFRNPIGPNNLPIDVPDRFNQPFGEDEV